MPKVLLSTFIAAVALLAPVGAAQAAPTEVTAANTPLSGHDACSTQWREMYSGTGNLHINEKVNKDGSITTHTHLHGTGPSRYGTDYVINHQSKLVWADETKLELISEDRHGVTVTKGSGDNSYTRFEYSGESSTIGYEYGCRG